jgi:putative cell wall-binding protein
MRSPRGARSAVGCAILLASIALAFAPSAQSAGAAHTPERRPSGTVIRNGRAVSPPPHGSATAVGSSGTAPRHLRYEPTTGMRASSLTLRGLVVLDTTDYFMDDGYYVAGRIRNGDPKTLDQAHVVVEMHDADDDLVAFGSDGAWVYTLDHDDTGAFAVWMGEDVPPSATHYHVWAAGRDIGAASADLKLSSVASSTDPVSGDLFWNGRVTNNTGRAIVYPIVAGSEWAAAPDAAWTYLDAIVPTDADSRFAELADGAYREFRIRGRWARPAPASTMLTATWTAQGRRAPDMKRVFGADRYATAAAIATEHWVLAGTVIIASGENFPDALSASALAGSYDAPLLLTRRDSVPQSALDALASLDVTRVIIVGGPPSVSSGVEDYLRTTRRLSVDRVFGADRYATAAKVARAVEVREGTRSECIIASGENFPDALAAAPYAYSRRMPILLVRRHALPASAEDVFDDLGIRTAYVVGSESTIDDDVIESLDPDTYYRISGDDRYATAAAVAGFAVDQGWATNAFYGIASGTNFPDAVGGGIAVGRMDGAMVLTRPASVPSPTYGHLWWRTRMIEDAHVFGGTPTVSADTYGALHDEIFNVGSP